MDKRGNFLAIALIDALEDENYDCVMKLIEEHGADPNCIVPERHLAPIHFSCGMENLELAENVTELFLFRGGDPNLQTPDDGLTPLHISAMSGRQAIVRMLLEKGGSIDIIDKENRTPLQYAVFDCHFEVIETIKKFVFEKKIEKVAIDSDKESGNNFNSQTKALKAKKFLTIRNIEENKYTPNKINYNFDITSPYYVNITHRRKDKQKNLEKSENSINHNYIANKENEAKLNPDEEGECAKENQTNQSFLTSTMNEDSSKKNLFDLTEENICELAKIETNEPSRITLIQGWRDKVQQSRSRQSIIYHYNNLDNLLDGIISNENVDFTNTEVELIAENKPKNEVAVKLDDTAFGKLLNTLRLQKPLDSETSFATALAPEDNKKYLSELSLVNPVQAEQILYQMSERYQYIDRDEGLIFFEEKLAMNTSSKTNPLDLNVSHSTISTQITVPSDYDTEALREELIKIGETPGPITKTTKRLYTKRLIKFKRDPQKFLATQASLSNNEQIPSYSIELLKTVRKPDFYERISEYYSFEEEMSAQFKSNHSISEKKWREGNKKQSFIYFLIDPRVSQNLPANSKFIKEHEVWKQFLLSIFYVGKGKSIRPYSHLYEAMKIHMRYKRLDNADIDRNEIFSVRRLIDKSGLKTKSPISLFQSPLENLIDNRKLTRILDIWKAETGVICLHVFHNILPAEAYTREAAIIDAIGLQHLCNMKRGDYYGPASAWTMRKRKCLGVGLLSKAMKIFLAEGESQLFPSDLI